MIPTLLLAGLALAGALPPRAAAGVALALALLWGAFVGDAWGIPVAAADLAAGGAVGLVLRLAASRLIQRAK